MKNNKNDHPLAKSITAHVGCVKCGAGYGKCDCWTPCKCGWVYEKGTNCNNPVHLTPKTVK